MLNFDFFLYLFKGTILFSAGGHSEEPWRASCPFRKVIKASWFFHISVQINFAYTINMQRNVSIKEFTAAFNVMFLTELLFKAHFNLVPADIMKNHYVHPVP